MGQYDLLRVKQQLPDGWEHVRRSHLLQTKSLERGLIFYTISADGRLLRDNDETGIDDETDHDGEVEFYDLDIDGTEHRYLVTFVGGQMQGQIQTIQGRSGKDDGR